jgi:hypothetical protein
MIADKPMALPRLKTRFVIDLHGSLRALYALPRWEKR